MRDTNAKRRRTQSARGSCGPDAFGVMHYECPGQNYSIDEATCNTRQLLARRGVHFHRCRRCTMRVGGKNDPR